VIDVFTEFSIKLEVILARASIRISHNKPDKCLNVKIIVFFFRAQFVITPTYFDLLSVSG